MKLNQYLTEKFPKVMEMLENKKRKLQILDTEGRVIENSPFIIFALTKNYEVNIHEDMD
jgi:hypothetical protein